MGKEPGLRAIYNDVKRRADNALHQMAEELSFLIETDYEQTVDAFYSDYIPAYYERGYNTYLASNGYDSPYSPQNVYKDGDAWVGGIEVGSTYIPGKPYRADTDWVFGRTFERGIHGYNRKDIMGMNKNRNKDTRIVVRNIKNMTPPPKKLMDRKFKDLTKKGNLNAMFDKAFASF